MSKLNFKISISPEEAVNIIRRNIDADLVHEEFNEIGNGQSLGVLVFEKYYMRVSNRAALIVIIDNLKGYTDVRVVSTGSSQGMIFAFDWGASDNFVNSVASLLEDYINGKGSGEEGSNKVRKMSLTRVDCG